MNSLSSIHGELTTRYIYIPESPIIQRSNYWVFQGQHR